jgi:hypothetical protein
MKISLVINCDTRPGINDEYSVADKMFDGCRNADFLTHGIWNKIKFFEGFRLEVILYIDQHLSLDSQSLEYLKSMCDCLVVRNHTEGGNQNDYNYLRALYMATGDIVVHFDQDSCAFAKDKEAVQEMIDMLNDHTIVSYPHWLSPNPDHNDNYDYWWASTRFFICRREFFDFTEIEKCLKDNEYFYSTYPASVRNPWLEHYLGLKAKYKGNGVYYPPLDHSKRIIFSWKSYRQGMLKMLNEMTFEQVQEWQQSHPMFYPNDINA